MKLTVNRIVKNWDGASKIKYTTTGFVENPMGPGRRFAKQNIDNELNHGNSQYDEVQFKDTLIKNGGYNREDI